VEGALRNLFLGLACAAGIATGATAENHTVGIIITFDEATIARLTSLGEWVTVSAYYFGDPAREDAPTDEMGMVYLGHEEANIFPANQRIELGGFLDAAPLEWAVEPLISVNIYSARFVDENNILDCGLVEGPVAALSAEDQMISCTLLGG
jgi:hypothetical protein